MVTEADHSGWKEEQLRPYFDTVIEAFGPKRLMFGTDWPVCLVAADYIRSVALRIALPENCLQTNASGISGKLPSMPTSSGLEPTALTQPRTAKAPP
jgi:L-fuconolactonase